MKSEVGDLAGRKIGEKVEFLIGAKIAHRGKHDNVAGVPENSLAAFWKAVKAGMPIELDVHLSKDGKVVVFHDTGLRRMTGKRGRITELTLLEIRELRLLGTKEKIPELNEVLEMVKGKVPVIIEVKFDRMPGKLEREMVKILDEYKGKFAVKSFSPLTMRWFLRNRPNYARGLLVNYKYHDIIEFLMAKMVFLRFVKPEFLSVDYRFYKSRKIQRMRGKMPVVAWTVRSKKTVKKIEEKFDGMIVEGEAGVW